MREVWNKFYKNVNMLLWPFFYIITLTIYNILQLDNKIIFKFCGIKWHRIFMLEGNLDGICPNFTTIYELPK